VISVSEADRLLGGIRFLSGTEHVPLGSAVGRVLAQAARADRDGPPFDRVTMDGYAVRAMDAEDRWVVRGFQSAGVPPAQFQGPGTAIEITTGAVLPEGYNAVVPYESTVREGDVVSLKPGFDRPSPGAFVHLGGSDYRSGAEVVACGTRLHSPHLHSLATLGVDPVPVVRRPLWALVATGDELVDVSAKPLPWQIRRSNTAAIVGEAASWGLAPRSQCVLPDRRDALLRGLQDLLPGLDVLVVTGGVSAGLKDFVPRVLGDLGAQVLFHRVAQRPGKPLWCGRIARSQAQDALVFGLPGNPVSSLFGFRRYVLPWLLTAEGRPPREQRVRAEGLVAPPPGFTLFLPWGADGPLDWGGSGNFHALGASTGFIEVNEDPQALTEPRYFAWGGYP